jgi:hypothetical protein
MLLGSMFMMFGRMERVTMRNLGMMSRFVMVRRLLMVMVNIVHLRLPACIDARALQMTNDVHMTDTSFFLFVPERNAASEPVGSILRRRIDRILGRRMDRQSQSSPAVYF